MTSDRLIAALPEFGGYVSLAKWAAMLAGLVLWLAICQWVDKDAWRLHYRRFTFNSVVVGAGVVGGTMWLLIPMFWIGLLFYAMIVGLTVGIYVYMRNQLVSPASKVLTRQHLAILFRRQLPEPKQAPSLVKLLGPSHQPLAALPESDPLYEGFNTGQSLLADGLDRRVEQLALAPSGRGVTVQYAIDGVLSNGVPLDRHTADLVIAYFKKMAGMDVNDRRRPQTGKLMAEEPGQPVDPQVVAAGYNVPPILPARSMFIEVRTSGSRAGETLTMRVSNSGVPLTLDKLGLSERQLQMLTEFRRTPGGVAVFGAADGVGSTTTFYQALRAHDAFMSNIQTLELRADGELENITQHVHKSEASEEVSFARQLQSIIRRGPDIVGVSLCKDKETAQLIARQAAEQTKFYVQMAGKDTFTLLARWAALVGDLKQAMVPARLLFAQSLVRKLCTGCREAYRPDPQLLRKINLPADRIERLYRPPTQIPADKHGTPIICPLCQGTGYLGRTGVFEVLVIDDELRRLVINNASANEIKKYCRAQKMLYLQEEALRKVISGETSINEVLRVFGGK